jgi:hypothetical protein
VLFGPVNRESLIAEIKTELDFQELKYWEDGAPLSRTSCG